MYTGDLIHKLRKANSKVYFKAPDGAKLEGVNYGGIWLKVPRKLKHKPRAATYVGAERLQATEAGWTDVMLTNVSYPEVPEFEKLNPTGKYINVKGWRSIVLDCVEKGVLTLDKARKIFAASLGESDWDKLSRDQKEAGLKREAAGKSWRKEEKGII